MKELEMERRMKLENIAQTQRLAQIIGETANVGDNLVLTGDLGVGKTTLTKGIAQGLGIDRMIKSPTYTIIREYEEGRIPLYHMDVYRVSEGAEELGLEEYFEGEGLCVIEWGNLLGDVLPREYLELILTKDTTNQNSRLVEFRAHGKQALDWLQEIAKRWE